MELTDDLVKISGATHEMAIDAVRYGLAAVTPFENDVSFGREEFFRRFNSDLANDLGNALNRSIAMTHKFVHGIIPDAPPESEVLDAIALAKQNYGQAMEAFRIDRACDAALNLVRFLNKYIDTRAPWALSKSGDPSLGSVLRSMLLCLRAVEGLMRPIMPNASNAIARQLGLPPILLLSEVGSLESLPPGVTLEQPVPLFPRIDMKNYSTLIEATPETPKQQKPMNTPTETPTTPTPTEEITIDDFMKVKLRVARIVEAEPLADSDKLMKLQVVIGEEKRQIIAGIRKSYTPEDLIGRQIVVVANLKPARLRGAESQGMLLAATDTDGSAILLMPDREAPEGASVK